MNEYAWVIRWITNEQRWDLISDVYTCIMMMMMMMIILEMTRTISCWWYHSFNLMFMIGDFYAKYIINKSKYFLIIDQKDANFDLCFKLLKTKSKTIWNKRVAKEWPCLNSNRLTQGKQSKKLNKFKSKCLSIICSLSLWGMLHLFLIIYSPDVTLYPKLTKSQKKWFNQLI